MTICIFHLNHGSFALFPMPQRSSVQLMPSPSRLSNDDPTPTTSLCGGRKGFPPAPLRCWCGRDTVNIAFIATWLFSLGEEGWPLSLRNEDAYQRTHELCLGEEWEWKKTWTKNTWFEADHLCLTKFLIIVSGPWKAHKRLLSTVYASTYISWLSSYAIAGCIAFFLISYAKFITQFKRHETCQFQWGRKIYPTMLARCKPNATKQFVRGPKHIVIIDSYFTLFIHFMLRSSLCFVSIMHIICFVCT